MLTPKVNLTVSNTARQFANPLFQSKSLAEKFKDVEDLGTIVGLTDEQKQQIIAERASNPALNPVVKKAQTVEPQQNTTLDKEVEQLASTIEQEKQIEQAFEEQNKLLGNYERLNKLPEDYQNMFSYFLKSEKIPFAALEDSKTWDNPKIQEFFNSAKVLENLEKNDPKYQSFLKAEDQFKKYTFKGALKEHYNPIVAAWEYIFLGANKLTKDIYKGKIGKSRADEMMYHIHFNKLLDMSKPALDEMQRENYNKAEFFKKEQEKTGYSSFISRAMATSSSQNISESEESLEFKNKRNQISHKFGKMSAWHKNVNDDIYNIKRAKNSSQLSNFWHSLTKTLDGTLGLNAVDDNITLYLAKLREDKNPSGEFNDDLSYENLINLDYKDLTKVLDRNILKEYTKAKEVENSLYEIKSKIAGMHVGEGLGESLNFMGQMAVGGGIFNSVKTVAGKALVKKMGASLLKTATNNPNSFKLVSKLIDVLGTATIMPSTHSQALENAIGDIKFLEETDEQGNITYKLGTNKETKEGLLKNINNKLTVLNNEKEKLQWLNTSSAYLESSQNSSGSNTPLKENKNEKRIREIQLEIEELTGLGQSFTVNGNMNTVVEDKSLGRGYLESFSQNSREVFTELFVGPLAGKGFSSLGRGVKKTFTKGFLSPIGNKVQDLANSKLINNIVTSRPGKLFGAGHQLSKNALFHTGIPKIYHGLPSEWVEELAVQVIPVFGEDYRQQVDELFNPSFHYDVALQTLLMGGGANVINTAPHLAKLSFNKGNLDNKIAETKAKIKQLENLPFDESLDLTSEKRRRNKDIVSLQNQLAQYEANNITYRDAVKQNRDKKKQLSDLYNNIDKSMTDNDLAQYLLMNTVGTLFHDSDYAAQISTLRLEAQKALEAKDVNLALEKNQEANVLEEKSFINRAITAYETDTLDDFRYALEGVLENKKITPETKAAITKGLQYTESLENIEDGLPTSVFSDVQLRKDLIDLKMQNLELEYSLDSSVNSVDTAVEKGNKALEDIGSKEVSIETLRQKAQRVIELQELENKTQEQEEELSSYQPFVKEYNELVKDENVLKALNALELQSWGLETVRENKKAIRDLQATDLKQQREGRRQAVISKKIKDASSLAELETISKELLETGNIDKAIAESIANKESELYIEENLVNDSLPIEQTTPEYIPDTTQDESFTVDAGDVLRDLEEASELSNEDIEALKEFKKQQEASTTQSDIKAIKAEIKKTEEEIDNYEKDIKEEEKDIKQIEKSSINLDYNGNLTESGKELLEGSKRLLKTYQENLKYFKEKLQNLKQELALLEKTPTQPTSTTKSNIEIKKAEIERRRQEELESIIPITTSFGGGQSFIKDDSITLNLDWKSKEQINFLNRVFGNPEWEQGKDFPTYRARWNFKNIPDAKFLILNIQNEKITTDTYKYKVVLENIDKLINTKYDAELKALEFTEVKTTPNQSDIEVKKAEIEKLKQEWQEELTPYTQDYVNSLIKRIKPKLQLLKFGQALGLYYEGRYNPIMFLNGVGNIEKKGVITKELLINGVYNIWGELEGDNFVQFLENETKNNNEPTAKENINIKYQLKLKALEEQTPVQQTELKEEKIVNDAASAAKLMSRYNFVENLPVPDAAKESMKSYIQEAQKNMGRPITIKEIYDNFLNKVGKDRLKNNFYNIAALARENGIVSSVEQIDMLFEAIYSPENSLMNLMDNTMNPLENDAQINKSEEVVKKETTPQPENQNADTNEIAQQVNVDSDDKRTDKSWIKAAYNFQDSVRLNAKQWETKKQLRILGENEVVDNHYILDTDFMSKVAHEASVNPDVFSARQFDSDDAILKKVNSQGFINLDLKQGDKTLFEIKVESKNPSITWGEAKVEAKKILGENTENYNIWKAQFIPVAAVYQGEQSNGKPVPLSMIHDVEWYSTEADNLNDSLGASKEKVRNEAISNVARLRIAIDKSEGKKVNIPIEQRIYGTTQKHSEISSIEDSNPQSSFGVVNIENGNIRIKIGNDKKYFEGEILNKKNLKNYSVVHFQHVRTTNDGKKQYIAFEVMTPGIFNEKESLKQPLDERLQDTIKYATLSHILLANRNNEEVVKFIQEKYDFTLEKALELHKHYANTINIDINNTISPLLAAFIHVDRESSFSVFKAKNIDPKHEGRPFIKHNNGLLEFNVIGKKQIKAGESSLLKLGGEVTNVQVLENNLNVLFNDIIPNTQPNLNLVNLENKKEFNLVNKEGNLDKDNKGNYSQIMQKFFKTNMVSHKIETIDGQEKWVSDVQPMIVYGSPIENNKQITLEDENVSNIENPVIPENTSEEIKNTISKLTSKEIANSNINVYETAQDLLNAGISKEDIPSVISQIIAGSNIQKIDNRLDTRWNPTSEQSQLLDNLKSNHIKGLTFQEQKALVNHLKNLIISGIDLNQKLSVQEIKEKIKEGIQEFLNFKIYDTSRLLNILEKTGSSLYIESFQNLLSLYETVNNNQHKIINQVSNEFTSIFSEDFGTIDTSTEDIDIEESVESWSKSALEKNVELTFSKELILSFFSIPKTDGKNNPIKNVLGLDEYHNADDVKRKLLDITSEIPSSWDALEKALDDRHNKKHINKTSKEDTDKEYLYSNIKNRLSNLPQKVKNELLSKTITEKVNLYKIEFDKKGNVQVLNEDSSKALITLSRNIQINFLNKFTNYKDKKALLNTEFASSVVEKLKEFKDTKELNPEKIHNFLHEIGFNNLGLNTIKEFVSKQGQITNGGYVFDIYSDNRGLFGLLEKHISNLLKQGEVEITKENNVFNNISTPLNDLVKTEALLNQTLLGNSIYIGGKTVQAIMPTTKFFDTNRSLIHNLQFREGFKNSAYTRNNYILNMMEIVPNFSSIFSQLGFPSIDTMKVKGEESSNNTEYDAIPKADHLKYTLGLYTSHNHKQLDNTKPLVDFPSLVFKMSSMLGITMADKGRTPIMTVPTLVFKGAEAMFTGDNVSLSQEVLDFLYQQIFESEYNRIKESYSNKTNYKDYENPSKVFHSIADFNTIQIDIEGEKVNLHTLLNKSQGFIPEKYEAQIRTEVEKILQNYISSEVKNKISLDVETSTVSGELIEEKLVEVKGGVLTPSFIDNKVLNNTSGTNPLNKLKTLMAEFTVNTLLANIAVSQQLYLSDPAFYSKMSVPFSNGLIDDKKVNDINYWKNQLETKFAPSLQKRAAQEIAPRQKIADSQNSNSKYSQEFAHIAINDVNRASESLQQMIENVYGEFTKEQKAAWEEMQNLKSKLNKISDNIKYQHEYNSLQKQIKSIGEQYFPKVADYFNMPGTDAQEYHTWQGYLETLERFGKITPEQRNEYTSIINSGNQLSEEQLSFLLTDPLSMQPLKGVYTGQVFDGKRMRPVYIKSSAFPLFPQLTQGLKIDKLRLLMENVETTRSQEGKFVPVRASYQTANKIGSLDTALNMEHIYNLNDTYSSEIVDTSISILPVDNWGIQQETPSKEVNYAKKDKDAYITMGSQFFKVITGNFISSETNKVFSNTFDKAFLNKIGIEVNNENLSGVELDEIYTKIYERYSQNLQNELFDELGLNLDFDSLPIESQNRVIEKITNIIKKEITERNYPDYLKDSVELISDELGKVTTESVLLMDNNRHKFESLLHALISNRLITHKLPGNSHVAASSEGFSSLGTMSTLSENTANSILWLDGAPQTNLNATVLENGELSEAEVLIKAHWKYKDVNGKFVYVDLSSPEFWENGQFKTDSIAPELLSMFSFRIPTSSHQSGAILKVKGFLPSWSEDLLIVPAEHAVQIGEDYDIDKRNLYKSHYQVELDNNGKPNRISKLSSDLENVSDFLDPQEKREILKNELEKYIGNIEEKNNKIYVLNQVSDYYGSEKAYSSIDKFLDRFGSNDLTDFQNIEKLVEEELELYKVEKNQIYKNYLEGVNKKFQQKLLENALIDVYKSVYTSTSSDVQNKIFKPLVTEVADNTASLMETKIKITETGNNFSVYSDSYQRSLLKNGADGKSGIGVHSNAVVLEAQFQRNNQKVNLSTLEYDFENGTYYTSPFTIVIGEQQGYINLGENKNTIEGSREIAEQHAENQNVSTDNINKQIMYKRNENSYTIGVYALMAHLGFDLSTDTVDTGLFDSDGNPIKTKLHIPSLFMNQPIIKDLVEFINRNSSTTSDFNANLEQEALDYLKNKYKIDEDVSFDTELTGQKLWNMLNEKEALNNPGHQLSVLDTFNKLREKSLELSKVQQLINLSTSKLGVSYFQTLQKVNTLNELAEKHFTALDNNLESNNYTYLLGEVSKEPMEGYKKIGEYYWKATTIEGSMVLNALEASNKLMPIFFPYESKAIQGAIEKVFAAKGLDINKKSERNLKLKYEIMTEMISYLNTRTDLFETSLSERRKEIFFDSDTNMATGSIIEHLRDIKSPLMENAFMKSLSIVRDKANNFVEIQHQVQEQTTFDKTQEYENFQELLANNENIKDEKGNNVEINGKTLTVRDLMVDLASYAMLAKDSMAVGFKNYIPTQFLKIANVNSNHRQMFTEIKEESQGMVYELNNNFVKQYFQHNPKRAIKKSGMYLEEFIKDEVQERPSYFYTESTNPTTKEVTMKLYELQSNGENYRQISLLGNNAYKEYDAKKTNVKSSVNLEDKTLNDLIIKGNNVYARNSRGEVKSMEFYKNLIKDNIKNVESLLQFINNLPITSAKDKQIIEEFSKYVNKDIKVEVKQLEGKELGYYQNDTIFIDENIIEKILTNITEGKMLDTQKVLKDVLLEELLHSMTANELMQHINVDAELNFTGYKTGNPPIFATRLVALFKAAQEAVPYNPQDTSTYYSKNIFEFLTGMYVSEEYTANLEEKIPNFAERVLKVFQDLFNYLWKNSSENISEQYKKEIHESIKDLMDYHKKDFGSKGVELNAKQKLEQIKNEDPTTNIKEINQNQNFEKKNVFISNKNDGNFTVSLSNTLKNFLEPFFNSQDENIVQPFAKDLTNEDKEILARAIGRNYKNISSFDWYDAIWSDVGQEEVFYYLKTGNNLEKDINNNLLNSKIYKEYQNFIKENKIFVDNFRNLPKDIQKEQQKDFNKLKEKDIWFKQQIDSFEYGERKKLLSEKGYIENNIQLNSSNQMESVYNSEYIEILKPCQ